AEPEAVDTIIDACARLPLALAVAAARAAVTPDQPLSVLADGLAATEARLDTLDAGEPASDVRAVPSWAYHGVPDEAQRLFRLLGLQSGPDLSAGAAASLAGIEPGRVRRTLRELVGAHLMAEEPPGRFRLHDLLQAYATELAA